MCRSCENLARKYSSQLSPTSSHTGKSSSPVIYSCGEHVESCNLSSSTRAVSSTCASSISSKGFSFSPIQATTADSLNVMLHFLNHFTMVSLLNEPQPSATHQIVLRTFYRLRNISSCICGLVNFRKYIM